MPFRGVQGYGGGAIGWQNYVASSGLSTPSSGAGSEADPATDAAALISAGKATNGSDDGTYWFIRPNGTNTKFQAYAILRDGGWIKVVQYNNGTNMSGTSAINAGGAWAGDGEVDHNPGKLHSDDINDLSSSKFIIRVKGTSDNFLNGRAGTGKFEYTGGDALSDWGTSQDPTSTHRWYLDTGTDGTYEQYCTYTADSRSTCVAQGESGHTNSIWVHDHNYNATFH